MIELKIATYDHMPDILDMFEEFHRSSSYKDCEFDVSKMSDVVISALEDKQNKCLVVLVDETSKAVGVIFGVVNEQIFNREKSAFEIVWWVQPEYRKGKNGLKLLNAFEYWASKIGCKYIHIGAAEGTENTDRLRKYYNRIGYTSVECNFVRKI